MPDRTWVSKTNVTSYLRCPYAFWLTDSGQLDRAELLSPFEAQLAETGIAFERGIVEAATPIEMPPEGDLCFSVWASPQGEAQALSDFGTFLDGFPDFPLITWNGGGADLPALRKASARAGCPDLVERIRDRHIDLFAWTRRNLMLPIPGFSLKEVSEHFGFSRQSCVNSGLDAEMQWHKYQRTGDQELKAELISYNMDDLGSLIQAVGCLRACAAGRPFDTAEPLHTVLEVTVMEREPGGPPICRPEAAVPARPRRRISRPIPRPRAVIASPASNRPRWRERILRWTRRTETSSSYSRI